MTLSEELGWRGFANQTTYQKPTDLDGQPITFYWGVDPSADSMTIGNLAAAMMVRHFMDHGHKAILLIGGATGMIGDPDGKSAERVLLTPEQIDSNKAAIVAQYKQLFAGQDFQVVDNYDWFKDLGYINFLRKVGKHVPMRQMLGREFVQSRLGEDGSGLSYAEFSYSLIQAYDFLHLHKEKGVSLQVCGADQWGNCIAGVDLIRRLTGDQANVWSAPLIVNKTSGQKFGKTEGGAVWLDPKKTSPTAFYQFWINSDDQSVGDHLKIYSLLDQQQIQDIIDEHAKNPGSRLAQKRLAAEVTKLVHGEDATKVAEQVTDYLTGAKPIGEAADDVVAIIKQEVPSGNAKPGDSIADILTQTGLSKSNNEARQFIDEGAISINGQPVKRSSFEEADFKANRLMLRRGKAFKDSALIEL